MQSTNSEYESPYLATRHVTSQLHLFYFIFLQKIGDEPIEMPHSNFLFKQEIHKYRKETHLKQVIHMS